jgi:hypothetical protein
MSLFFLYSKNLCDFQNVGESRGEDWRCSFYTTKKNVNASAWESPEERIGVVIFIQQKYVSASVWDSIVVCFKFLSLNKLVIAQCV